MKYSFLFILMSTLLIACQPKTHPNPLKTPKKLVQIGLKSDSSTAFEVAKNITYDVKIRASIDDDDWTKTCLKETNPEALSNSIFKSIYEKKLTAFDYFTDEKLSIREVKAFEKEYARNRIGKLQFIEDWYYDETNFKFYKEVHGIMMAYERYKEDGSVKSYKAGIKVFFK